MEKPKTGQAFVMHADIPAEDMPTWTKRRIAAHGEDLMLVENEFMTGDTAPEHSAVAVEDSLIIDLFAPQREDFSE